MELQAEIDDLRTKHAKVLNETKMIQDVKDADVQEVIPPCEVFCLLLSKIFNHKFRVSFSQQIMFTTTDLLLLQMFHFQLYNTADLIITKCHRVFFASRTL